MKSIQNLAAQFFILCVVVLTAISILGVWDVFGGDVIVKSFETLGILALVAVVILVAGRFVGTASTEGSPLPEVPNPVFREIRNITLITLIASVVILAFLGVLTIWDIITDTSVLHRSISSMMLLAFSSFVIVVVCLEREKNAVWQKRSSELSIGLIVGAVLLSWVLTSFK